ncbi:hypothetical protein J3E69DRAFT_333358 [Trichoderma sp. SZMC 28015]
MALSSRSVRESCHSPELERMRLNSVCACGLAWRRGRFIHFAKNPRLWPVLGGHWPATEQMISSCRWRMARRFVDAPRRLVACNYSEWERWDGLETGRAKKNEGAGVLLGILSFYFARFVLFRGRQSSHRSVIWVMILVYLFYFILFILFYFFLASGRRLLDSLSYLLPIESRRWLRARQVVVSYIQTQSRDGIIHPLPWEALVVSVTRNEAHTRGH